MAQLQGLRSRASKTHPTDRILTPIHPGQAPSHGDTTYFTVADSDGMMISMIQSNFCGMGSGLVADGLGFMFQDRAELFSLQDGHPNLYQPGKRPFQTIIPGFATKDGKPWMSFGVMGGDMQPQGQTQIIVNRVDTASTSRPPATAQDGTTKAHPKPWAKTQLDLTPKASSASKPESPKPPAAPSST